MSNIEYYLAVWEEEREVPVDDEDNEESEEPEEFEEPELNNDE